MVGDDEQDRDAPKPVERGSMPESPTRLRPAHPPRMHRFSRFRACQTATPRSESSSSRFQAYPTIHDGSRRYITTSPHDSGEEP